LGTGADESIAVISAILSFCLRARLSQGVHSNSQVVSWHFGDGKRFNEGKVDFGPEATNGKCHRVIVFNGI